MLLPRCFSSCSAMQVKLLFNEFDGLYRYVGFLRAFLASGSGLIPSFSSKREFLKKN